MSIHYKLFLSLSNSSAPGGLCSAAICFLNPLRSTTAPTDPKPIVISSAIESLSPTAMRRAECYLQTTYPVLVRPSTELLVYKTRPARDRILSIFLFLSSWVANPSTLVPIGSPLPETSTHAFRSNFSTVPSFLLNSFLVSTMTAFCTCIGATMSGSHILLQDGLARIASRDHWREVQNQELNFNIANSQAECRKSDLVCKHNVLLKTVWQDRFPST